VDFDEEDYDEVSNWPKQWCECRYSGFTGLFDLEYCKNGDYVWVCGGCSWPSYMYWETFIDTCSECGAEYNAPWEDLCNDCTYRFPNERPLTEPYCDWFWAHSVTTAPGTAQKIFDQITTSS
jgi:hypothetical protein